LFGAIRTLEFPTAGKNMCEELQTLKREAVYVLRAVKSIRRSRDLTFYEDAELNRKKHHILNAVLKHLLAGHQGKPCPAGDRPIVSLDKTARLAPELVKLADAIGIPLTKFLFKVGVVRKEAAFSVELPRRL
jgi:hypothetical protein